MYAIIQDGGKQYTVSPGQFVEVEKKDLEVGSNIEFSEVVYYQKDDEVKVGAPTLKNVKVKGVVKGHLKGPKLIVFKFRRRKDSRCKKGHRQKYTKVEILDIVQE